MTLFIIRRSSYEPPHWDLRCLKFQRLSGAGGGEGAGGTF